MCSYQMSLLTVVEPAWSQPLPGCDGPSVVALIVLNDVIPSEIIWGGNVAQSSLITKSRTDTVIPLEGTTEIGLMMAPSWLRSIVGWT